MLNGEFPLGSTLKDSSNKFRLAWGDRTATRW
jgi:hypothetical protein